MFFFVILLQSYVFFLFFPNYKVVNVGKWTYFAEMHTILCEFIANLCKFIAKKYYFVVGCCTLVLFGVCTFLFFAP